MPTDTALIETLLAPIPGANPSGKDVRYDPRYGELKEARREDDVLPEGGLATARKLADWPLAVKVARALLEKETKDLQVAAWLTEALLRREGFGGLATGLQVVRGILDQFWESCYPEWDEEDPELRAAPIEWIASKLDLPVRQTPIAPGGASFLDYLASRGVPTETEAENSQDKKEARDAALAEGKPAPEQIDRAVAAAPKAYYKALIADVDAALAALNALALTVDDKFGRDAPSFSRFSGTIEEVKRLVGGFLAQKLVDDPDPVAADGSAGGDAGTASSGGGTGEDGGVAGGGGPQPAEPVSAVDAAARAAAAARYLRKQDPTNPSAYLLLRGLRWGELRAGGLDGSNGHGAVDPKLLEAPATPIRSRLKGLLLDEKWTELLEQSEGVMATPQGRGWLDLQRYVLTACDNLGGGYEAVAAAVRGELRALLAALPRLPEMTLMDDTPTANAETQAWLAAEGIAGDGADPSADGAYDSEIEDQTESLEDGLAEDDQTSEPGGLRAGGRRRGPIARGNGTAASARRDPFAAARAELAAGRPNRAIELLTTELARERSPRGRFIRQTQIAYVMVEAGLDGAARPILESLAKTIEERHLEEWEAGALVAQPLALLCRVVARMEGGVAADPGSETYQRVCRLDPLQAIALQRATA